MTQQGQAGPPVVAVFNHKGGVAKSTTASNIAVCLAASGRRTLLVDLDAQGTTTASFSHRPLPETGAVDVIFGPATIAQAALPTPFPNLTLLPATAGLRLAELELAGDEGSTHRLGQQIASDGASWDIVVVDCPPSFGMVTLNGLLAASAVLIPARPDPFAREALANSWYEVKRLGQEANAQLAITGILLTMTESSGPPAEAAKAIRTELGEPVFATEIAADPGVSEAAHLSLPVTVVDPDGVAGRAYVKATAELLRRLRHRDGNGVAPEGFATETLNILREWRAGQAALQRIPRNDRGRVGKQRTIAPEPKSLVSEIQQPTDHRVDRIWLPLAFILGVAIGAGAMAFAPWNIPWLH